MIHSQRIIFSDNATLIDCSIALNDYIENTKVLDFVSAQDYLYIGSELPFNHKYFDLKVLNVVSASVAINVWFGNAWVPVVDIIDDTKAGAASLGKSGIIQWNTNRLKGWDVEQDSEDVTGLAGTVIYDFYWTRFKWSANLTATTELKYIGLKFSNDLDLYSYYPDLNQQALRTAYESSLKLDWNEQTFSAANIIARDLKRRNIIISKSQILDHELFLEASVHKTAELIYAGLGQAYVKDKDSAAKSYDKAMDIKYFKADLNTDGSLGSSEKIIAAGFMTR